jgi:hypothetical protein
VALRQQLLRNLAPVRQLLRRDRQLPVLGTSRNRAGECPRANQQSFKPLDSPIGISQNQKPKGRGDERCGLQGNRINPDARANCPPRHRRTTGSPNAPMTVQGLVQQELEWPNSVPAHEPARPRVWEPPAWQPGRPSFSQGSSWRWPSWQIFSALPPSPSLQISSRTSSRTSWPSSPTSSKISSRIFSSPSEAFCSF